MQCHFVEARDLPDAWFQLVDLCYRHGRDYRVTEGSYADAQFRRELDYVTVHIRHPHTMPMLPEIPPGLGIPDPVPEGMDYVERYLPYLMTDEQKEGEEYTYGQRLFGDHWRDLCKEEIDALPKHMPTTRQTRVQGQALEVVEKFKRSFGNNQACMTIAQPSDISLPNPPCLRQIDCRIFEKTEGSRTKAYGELDEEQLHFIIYFRSWDLWGGFPANLAAIACLQQHMADLIGVAPGEMICSSKGLHLYDMYWELAKIRLGETDG